MNLQLNDRVIITRKKGNKIYAEEIISRDENGHFFTNTFQIRDDDFYTRSQDPLDFNKYKLLLVLREDEHHDLKTIYDFRNSDETTETDIEDTKGLHKCENVGPADVAYDKYAALLHENEELKNIIVELNKKLYGKNNKIH